VTTKTSVTVDSRRLDYATKLRKEVPSVWSILNVGDLCAIQTGKLDVNQADEGGIYPFFTCAERVYKINDYAFDSEAVLVAGNGFFNVKYYSGKFNAYQRTYVLSDIKPLGKYFYHYINYRLGDITGESRGSTISYIRLGDLRDYPVAVAPPKQQKQIVEEIEKQFSRLDKTIADLKRVKANLKRYKASVLQAAVTGKLTEAWRKQNPDVEPASKLLERILIERRQKWEATELAKLTAKGKTPKNDKWKEKYKEPAGLTSVIPIPNVPKSWKWASVDQVGTVGEQPVLTGPFGSNIGKKDFQDTGVPVITIGCLKEQEIDLKKARFVSEEKALELERYKLQEGDMLFSRMAEVGRAGFVTKDEVGSIFNYHLMRLRLASHVMNPNYFVSSVRGAAVVADYVREVNHGATRDGINTSQLQSLPVALPPFKEQKQILLEIEQKFSVVFEIERTVNANLKRAELLRQSILKQAFSGKLI